MEKEEEEETNFDRSNAKSTGLEKEANAASSYAFAETAYHSTSHQHVLHFFCFSEKRREEKRAEQSRAERRKTKVIYVVRQRRRKDYDL